MFDIHMHVIPGVDDGSWSLEMSQRMLQMAYMQGVRSVIATPHSQAFLYNAQRVLDNYQQLQQYWEDYVQTDANFRRYMGDEPMSLYLGCEVRCSLEQMGETSELLRRKVLPSLNDTEYVLTEFDPWVSPQEAVLIVILLVSDGWVPVIAHAERYPNLRCDGELDEILSQGCLLQINAYSLANEEDQETREWARHLLSGKKITFLGSDAHRTTHRPPDVADGVRYIYDHCDRDYADQIVFRNAIECILV